jgi:hypothetical protein
MKPSLFGRATAVLGEHATLHATLDLLRGLSSRLLEASPASDADARTLLEGFSMNVHAHFAAEENDGYFGTLVEDCPELGERVASLEAEHGAMRAELARLLELSLDARSERELGQGLAALLDRFLSHERSENAILQEFFLRDDGVGG